MPHDVLGWLNDLLIDRKQCVVPNRFKSGTVDLTGWGYSKALGLDACCFFVSYINDIALAMRSHIILYADDCVGY